MIGKLRATTVIEGRAPATRGAKCDGPDAEREQRSRRPVKRLIHEQKGEYRKRREDEHRRRTKPARKHRAQCGEENPGQHEQDDIGERCHPHGVLADEDQPVKHVFPRREQRDFAEAGEQPEPKREAHGCERAFVRRGVNG